MICHCWVGFQEGPGVWEVLGRGRGVSSSSSWLLSSTNLSLLSTIQHLPRPAREKKTLLNPRKKEDKYRKLPIAVLPCWVWCQTLYKGAMLRAHIWCTDLCTQSYLTLVTSLLLHDFFWSLLSPFLLLWHHKLNCWAFQRSAWGTSFPRI